MNKFTLIIIAFTIFSSCHSTTAIKKTNQDNTVEQYNYPHLGLPKKASIKNFNYAQFLNPNEKVKKEGINYIISENSKGENIARYFYFNTDTLISYTTYTSNYSDRIKHGLAKEYSINGNLIEEGMYNQNKKDGHWKLYNHKTKLLKSEGNYTNGKRTGTWKYYDYKGRLKKEYNFNNDEKNGKFIVYDTLSNIGIQGIYSENEFVSADTLIPLKDPEIYNSDELDEPAYFQSDCQTLTDIEEIKNCRIKAMLEFVFKTIRYPEIERENGISGTTTIEFEIEIDGSISNLNVIKSASQSMTDQVKRVINAMPKWMPGKKNGQKVRTRYILPVNFKT